MSELDIRLFCLRLAADTMRLYEPDALVKAAEIYRQWIAKATKNTHSDNSQTRANVQS